MIQKKQPSVRRALRLRNAVIFLVAASAGVFLVVVSSCASLGKLPSGERLERIEKSPHYVDGVFKFPGTQPESASGESSGNMFSSLWRFLFGAEDRNKPSEVLPSAKTDLFSLDPDENLIVWMGHSSYYLQVDGKKFLVDPVFSGSAFVSSAFSGSDVYTPEDIPPIDYLVITHDHWDHLDYKTVTALKDKTGVVLTGLGTGEHLEYWGYAPPKIMEHDWNETRDLGAGFSVTAIATPHFSGRFLTRNKSLWTAFALITPNRKIFIGGDSGYGDHFADAGRRFGPFDLALLECGQYNRGVNHMFPEDTARASIDLGAKKLFPVHWAKFALNAHAWDEPIIRLAAECEKRGITLLHPIIGSAVRFDEEEIFPRWWEGIL
ncbi:MAG: MBL fold metallo-hydrolase [Spirochaetales bacterium]|jgi:L-ascorbate metabolism protein UlaG (beta-lactamase superfamily)|nr:MBL fold metallo-hydrolase [Spirochaetales bacterium]